MTAHVKNNVAMMLDQAMQEFSNGNLPGAEVTCRKILEQQMTQPDAWHLLGLIAAESSHPEPALECINKAIHYAPAVPDYYNSIGLVLLRLGRFQEARDSLRKSVETSKNFVEGWFNLSNAYRELGEKEQAVSALKEVLRIKPDHLPALNNIANLYKANGDADRALEAFSNLLDKKSGYAPAHFNIGLLYKDRNEMEKAEKHFKRAIELQSGFVEAWYQYGCLLLESGQYPLAINAFDRVMELDSDHDEALLNKAQVLFKMGEYKRSGQILHQVLDKSPGNHAVRNQLGLVFLSQGLYEKAENEIQKILSDDPHNVSGLNNLAQVKQGKGEFEEVRKILKKLISIEQNNAVAWKNYAMCKKFTIDEIDFFKAAENLLETSPLADKDRSQLHFALGKIYDDTADYEKAFHHFRKGNEIRGIKDIYNADLQEHHVTQIMDVFNTDFFREPPVKGSSSSVPVFIVGMPRSSTTLVEQIASSHSEVFGAGEQTFFNKLVLDWSRVKDKTRSYPVAVRNMTEDQAGKICSDYLEQITCQSNHSRLVTDKMPLNFLHLGLIALLFPETRVIHCCRNPLDTCISNFNHDFVGTHYYSHTFENLAHFYAQYHRLMQHWHENLPIKIFDFQYEEYLDAPEIWSQNLIEFLGLEWEPQCLEFQKNKRNVRTSSDWQVRQPIFHSSRERWRNYEPWIGPLQSALRDYGVIEE